ncbi:hypothetical protein HPB51_018626 [Rhipicephalus microplus]|uniref:Fucosyltransferase N-terminal domain-containing protein n=1 Tax=Rhipicephalus microplus TaxID=6941 RepID=A0A9J6F854_RHIMP|nr:hypothetical protein HPB51_018626 [Rhipicephalus microplus]
MEDEMPEMLPFEIPMTRLRHSLSPSSSIVFLNKSGHRRPRLRKQTCITIAVITLSILLTTALIVQQRKAPLVVEDCVEAHMLRWLPWNQRANDSKFPRILLWSPAVASSVEPDASQPVIYFGNSRAFKCASNLGEAVACEVTMQHRRTTDSDALVFYGESITALLLPKCRSAEQMCVFWVTADLPPPKSHDNLSPISGLFNWTMGRRNDADVMVAYKTWHYEYGIRKYRNHGKMEAHMHKRKYREDAAWIVGE